MSAMTFRIPFAEAKNKLSELVDRAAGGEEITITRYNQDVVRLVPARSPSRESVERVIASINELRKGRHATVDELIAWKNEGRR